MDRGRLPIRNALMERPVVMPIMALGSGSDYLLSGSVGLPVPEESPRISQASHTLVHHTVAAADEQHS